MRILQINREDCVGGAGRVAWNLFQGYRARGHASWMAVHQKTDNDPDIYQIPFIETRHPWTDFCQQYSRRFLRWDRFHPGWGAKKIHELFSWLSVFPDPQARKRNPAWEYFDFPETRRILDLPPEKSDLLHCHNLHGDYFDLTLLPWLSHQVPLALTLHDAWLLSGHCAHSFDCERWKIGCGQCPDLTIYPALKRDGTDYNWRRKRDIYRQSRLYVAAPSRWLMDKVEGSMLMEGAVQTRVIPNGVDLDVFQPGDKAAARRSLGIPPQARVLLFAANSISDNQWKDWPTLRQAVALASEALPSEQVIFLGVGEEGPVNRIGRAEARFVPFLAEPGAVARYYQAADLYLHAAKADTFPNTIIESLACGTPVVATRVGGIPEQVISARVDEGATIGSADALDPRKATGAITPPKDPDSMAKALCRLLGNSAALALMSANASRDARERFGLERQIQAYLDWYANIIEDCRSQSTGSAIQNSG
ncbi:MAG: glycosyltransferase [Candidatus Sumerlaeota bacterium]|nr:glycosyltransferase [Candidatus Sumerlaeota bacterium]